MASSYMQSSEFLISSQCLILRCCVLWMDLEKENCSKRTPNPFSTISRGWSELHLTLVTPDTSSPHCA